MTYALSIQSLKTPDCLRYPLNTTVPIYLGRSTKAMLSIPWDPAISRDHAVIQLVEKDLHVQCLPSARNPAVFEGVPAHSFIVHAGQEFRIGSTSFQLIEVAPPAKTEDNAFAPYQINGGKTLINVDAIDDSLDADLLEQHSFAPGELARVAFGNADERIEMLSQLPQLIANSKSDEDLALALAGVLLRTIRKSVAVAVAHFPLEQIPYEHDQQSAFPKPHMLRIETRDRFDGTFRPSRRLIQKALSTNESVMQIWHGSAGSANFTMSDGLGWAIVIPVPGQSCRGWCLYISGSGSEGTIMVTKESLQGDLRCAELIAQFLGSIRQVRLLESQKTRMSSFFSPKIVESLTDTNSDSQLSPVERDVAVLFCDVRNFSQKAEDLSNDLRTLQRSVSSALGAMTDGILDFDGTIADFQGDAALGFWGWPVENDGGPIPACMAALKILERFETSNENPASLLNGFSIGMGISYGPALAGEIGTSRQSKLGVFGPVVNSGSRLQGLSKKFGVAICIDEATAEFARRFISRDTAITRRLGNVIPRGMTSPMNIYSLEPTYGHVLPSDSESVYETFELALDSVQSGDWSNAVRILRDLPNSDGPTRFLKDYLEEQGMEPPSGWSGTIEFQTK